MTNWETGVTTPSDDYVSRIAAETGFPFDFFMLEDAESLAEESVTFRARSRIPARQKRSALAAGTLARDLATWIERQFELPVVDLPDLSGQPIDLVARVVRSEWMLGDKPIPNMIHLLESRGILVFSLAQNVAELDAFSFWADGRPVVLLNTMKSAERSRMDAAHELLHLLSHKDRTGRKEEEEADGFAGAFLMPKDDVYRHLPRLVGLSQLIEAKQRWRVSLSALVYRLHTLGIASDWQYRTLFVELSKRGYRTEEPNPIATREGSMILSQVFSSLGERGIPPSRVARELSWPRRQLDELIFGLGAALLPLEGGGQSSAQIARPQLHIVRTREEH